MGTSAQPPLMVELGDQKRISSVCVCGLRGVSPQHLFPFPAGFIKLQQKEKIMDGGLAAGAGFVSVDTPLSEALRLLSLSLYFS